MFQKKKMSKKLIKICKWEQQKIRQIKSVVKLKMKTNKLCNYFSRKIIIHKKKCETFNNCKITTIENSTNNEIKLAILKRAARIEKENLVKTKKEIGDIKLPKNF